MLTAVEDARVKVYIPSEPETKSSYYQLPRQEGKGTKSPSLARGISENPESLRHPYVLDNGDAVRWEFGKIP